MNDSLILSTRIVGKTLIQERLRPDGRIETLTNRPSPISCSGPVTVSIGPHTMECASIRLNTTVLEVEGEEPFEYATI